MQKGYICLNTIAVMKTFCAIAICLSAILFAACSKDKFETKPKIEFAEYTKIVDPGGQFSARINYYDKEGDLNGGTLVALRVRLNNNPPIAPGEYKAEVYPYTLPNFPSKDKAEILFQLPYFSLDETLVRNDTCLFKFVVTDKAGNASDTLVSDVIVARQP